MKALGLLGRVSAWCGLVLLAGCTEQEVVAELPSLSGSEDAVFLCRDEAGVGHPYSDCPDRDSADDAKPSKKLSVFALVTQTVTDEVAVVDVTAGNVVDADPARPGYGFLRVGGRPISMAATPGGRATFVATADVGRNGIFALPTSCLGAPKPGETERDLTSWPACRLDETPGELSVLVEPFADAPPAVSAGATLAADGCRVDGYADDGDVDAGRAADSSFASNVCQGDLRDEAGGEGRRKLVVALPESGELGVIDAQELLNTPAGTFPPCHFEQRVKLQVDVPAGVAQTLPADLTGNLLDPSAACNEVAVPMAPGPGKRSPQPAGFAQADNRLYIADQAAPVVHVVDTSSVCGMAELSPLLPMSLREPTRVVTTRRVAVSPLTPAGQRFAYAIDAEDQPGASVMVFDVSPGATDRTPIVRSGSPELPNERPDRLLLGSAAKDVTFAYRDIPYVDPSTGVAEFGTRCNPDLSADAKTPAGLARPVIDDSTGARPGLLRGLFGFILLTNGQIAIVDVDDFDADCRRPISINASSVPDFRGCVNDAPSEQLLASVGEGQSPFFTLTGLSSGVPLVTNEVSCRVVEPHRFRSSRLAVNDTAVGVRAPSLRAAPQLSVPASASNTAFSDRPRLLAVPFAGGEAADVYIGASRFSTSSDQGVEVVTTDPNDKSSEAAQTQQSVVLPPLEPRSYAADDNVTVTYEGAFFTPSGASGFLKEAGKFQDPSVSFCGAGVYDVATMKGYAQSELGVADDAAAETFARAHADYVQLTTALREESDSYWAELAKPKSGSTATFAQCLALFGPHDADPLSTTRDFRIVSAHAGELTLESRDDAEPVDWELLRDCFPTSQTYHLRAGSHWVLRHDAFGFRHDIVASGADSQCVRSCDPLRKWSKGRVFEISSEAGDDPDKPHCRATDETSDPLDLRVGCATEQDVACVYDQVKFDDKGNPASSQVGLGDAAAACIFNGLNDRFALYRGRAPSKRDSAFSWHTTGGFTPLLMSLTSVSEVVAPQSIQFLQHPEQLAVVDGASQGLALFSLDTFSVVKPSPFN